MSAKRDVNSDSQIDPHNRPEPRVQGVRDISVTYEGRREQIHIRPPDLSLRGMFISTSRVFPEGSVLSLRFRLAHTGVDVQTRCEVRHCLPGVGIGVEFVGVTPEAAQEIAREIAYSVSEKNRP